MHRFFKTIIYKFADRQLQYTVYLYKNPYMPTNKYIHTYMYSYIHAYMHIYIHTYISDTYIHTHIQKSMKTSCFLDIKSIKSK